MKTMDIDNLRNAVAEICLDLGGKLRVDYSGRGMYGATCYGIVTDDPDACVEEAAARGIRGSKRDSMGRQAIVYWPHIAGIVTYTEPSRDAAEEHSGEKNG